MERNVDDRKFVRLVRQVQAVFPRQKPARLATANWGEYAEASSFLQDVGGKLTRKDVLCNRAMITFVSWEGFLWALPFFLRYCYGPGGIDFDILEYLLAGIDSRIFGHGEGGALSDEQRTRLASVLEFLSPRVDDMRTRSQVDQIVDRLRSANA